MIPSNGTCASATATSAGAANAGGTAPAAGGVTGTGPSSMGGTGKLAELKDQLAEETLRRQLGIADNEFHQYDAPCKERR